MERRVVANKNKTRILYILMNGKLIGRLTKTSKGALIYQYTQEWLETSAARSISLSLPLSNKVFSGDIVYNFFDNLLPENPQVRARIQAEFQTATTHPFDLLASIGKDCVGAIQMVTEEVQSFKREIQYEVLTEAQIAALLRNHQLYPLGMKGKNDAFRISIAGAQEKTAFLFYKKEWCRPLNTTPTTHIFKLPIGYLQHQQMDLGDSCENEWLCSKIAEAFDLPVAKTSIRKFEEVKVLIVERFDRGLSSDKSWIMRLPQEDMCQTQGISPSIKYQSEGGPGISQIMDTLLGSDNSNDDREIFFKSQILFWLLGAIDGHAKNFSIFLEAGGRYRLTPLYDIISAYPLVAKKQLAKQKLKMAMALKGNNNHYSWHTLQRRHFLMTAKAANYSMATASVLIDSLLARVDQVISKVESQLPSTFPTQIYQPIFEGMLEVKKKLEA